MKYNVGDKVVDKDSLKFFFNPFWSDDYRYCKTVTEATDKYFSVYMPSRGDSAIEEGLSCGANEYMVFYQKTGKTKNWASTTNLLHIEKDKQEILDILQKYGEEYFQKEKEYYERQIKDAKSQWVRSQRFFEDSKKANSEFLKLKSK